MKSQGGDLLLEAEVKVHGGVRVDKEGNKEGPRDEKRPSAAGNRTKPEVKTTAPKDVARRLYRHLKEANSSPAPVIFQPLSRRATEPIDKTFRPRRTD